VKIGQSVVRGVAINVVDKRNGPAAKAIRYLDSTGYKRMRPMNEGP